MDWRKSQECLGIGASSLDIDTDLRVEKPNGFEIGLSLLFILPHLIAAGLNKSLTSCKD